MLSSKSDTSLILKSKNPDNPIVINSGANNGALERRDKPIPKLAAPNIFLLTTSVISILRLNLISFLDSCVCVLITSC